MRPSWKRRETSAAAAQHRLAAAGLCALLSVWVGEPARVYASPSDHVTLELEAPAPCPGARALLEHIDAQLGADFATDTRLHALARVRELAAADYELRVQYETSTGAVDERNLRGESCVAVTDAAVLLLAIALNPSAALVGPANREPVGAAEALLSPELGLLGELDTSPLPRVSFGLGAQLGLRIGPLELQARGRLFLPRDVARSGTTTTFNAYSFDLGLCVPWRLGRFMIGPCARAEVGRLSGSVEGVVQDRSPDAARFQALALGAELHARIAAPLWLTLGADFTWFLRRPEFVVADLGEVGRPAKLGMRVYFGPLLAW